jgi:hypothetical protein
MNPKLIAAAYIDTWNEGDARKRGLLFDEYWTNDARYEDPLMQGEGVGAIVDVPGSGVSLLSRQGA